MTPTDRGNAWIVRSHPRGRPRLRLFCLPYAGGAASAYRTWPQALPADVDVCAVQLPGRAGRFREPAFTRVGDLAPALAEALRPLLDVPFAVFGHSMGALVAFELARELRRRALPAPARLIVSGREAPHRPDPDPPIRDLPDASFLGEVQRRYDAIPAEVLAEPELMQLLLPVIRADFTLIETYGYRAAEPLACPITCFGGTEDDRVGREDLEAWAEQTRGAFNLRIFAGGHFFVDSARDDVLRAIVDELAEPAAQAVAP